MIGCEISSFLAEMNRAKIPSSLTFVILVAPKGAVFFKKKGVLVETHPPASLINVKRFREWIS